MTFSARRRAVIDIGTNSVKLLVAEVLDGHVTPVYEDGVQTRLGRGFYTDHRLRPEAIAATADAVSRFASAARGEGAVGLRIVATSATREARNAEDLAIAVEAAVGVRLEVLDGVREAELAFAGAISGLSPGSRCLLILDVGGGSTEFVLGLDRRRVFSRSHALGTVRLHEMLRPGDPPRAEDCNRIRQHLETFLRGTVLPDLAPALARLPDPACLVGTGGTAAVLACLHLGLETYDRARIESVRLSLADLDAMCAKVWSVGLAERRQLPGMPHDRADIVPMGVAIYRHILEVGSFSSLAVSTRGLRFALVAED
jgi:exopolyphosphatase/guanosine-5'-triphosphate,3'-diphosphate pyrophosphatase